MYRSGIPLRKLAPLFEELDATLYVVSNMILHCPKKKRDQIKMTIDVPVNICFVYF